MSDVIVSVEVLRLADGGPASIPAADAGFSYRRSSLPTDAVVTGVTVALTPGDPSAIREEMDAARDWRRRTQPIAEPNCGSVFKNPPDDHAARLIEAAGCKGRRVGGAEVSTKHANFIVTAPGARAEDVLALIRAVQATVEADAGILLEREVHLVGAFADEG
jgi:UDP-N-acetylmuramate dehydrogenase